ncbi:hypothetical protein [Nonomuraea sp. NPDC050643]|uniref:hypothetical protein n=1 Tax=Nonomuraea sp. NPDC050643 TaxID=3155660 RepID=UPI0034062F17
MTSSAGLVLLTFGLTRAGQDGWTATGPLLAMAGGTSLLIAFVLWQLHLTNRPSGRPLLDLGLFRSRHFTGGALLQTLAGFVFFGLLFAVPQYFQAVLGADAMGSGLRLLPLLAGVIVGSSRADRIAARITVRATLAIEFAILAGSLAAGALTSVSTDYGVVAAWMAARTTPPPPRQRPDPGTIPPDLRPANPLARWTLDLRNPWTPGPGPTPGSGPRQWASGVPMAFERITLKETP